MSLNTEHRGYDISFDEDTEMWSCRDLGLEPNKSLKSLKRSIDEHLKGDRRIDIMALRIHHDGRDRRSLREVKVTVLCEPTRSRYSNNSGAITDCWVTEGKERWKENIDSLYPLSARTSLQHYLKRVQEVDKLSDAVSKEFEQIDAYDADQLLKEAGKSKAKKK